MDSREDELLDVVNSKVVVPPDIVDILKLEEGNICRISYSGRYYKAEVVPVGK